ncbi:MAG: hypothetical protein QXT68_04365 [Halobacteria archaeon]
MVLAAIVGLAADLAKPPDGGAVSGPPQYSPLREIVRTFAVSVTGVALNALGAPGGGEGTEPGTEGVLYLLGPPVEGFPLPSWAVLVGAALLLAAMVSRTLHRRPAYAPVPEPAEGREAPLLFAAPSRGPLFKQTVIYVNLAPRWGGLGPTPRGRAAPRPAGGAGPRRLQGVLEAPRSAPFWSSALVLPYGEP